MAIARLSEFGFLAVTGRDAAKFLQGYTTCDIERLPPGGTSLGAICNLQGRMVTNFRAARDADGLLLRMSAPLVPATREFLQKYIVFSKAELRDMSDSLACYGCTDEGIDDASVTVELGDGRTECWAPPGLPDTGDAVAWRTADVAAGMAWVTDETTGEYLPQSFAMHHHGGIDFDKGCYLGQEIVARMQYRGELKLRLHHASTGDGIPHTLPVGTTICAADGAKLGEVVASSDGEYLAVLRHADGRVAARLGDRDVEFTSVD